eukprot:gene5336-8855_t
MTSKPGKQNNKPAKRASKSRKTRNSPITEELEEDEQLRLAIELSKQEADMELSANSKGDTMDEVGVCDSSKSANSHDDIHSNQENGSSKKIESRHSNLEASLSEENPTSTQENEHQRKAVPAIQRLPLPPASPPSSRSTRHKRVIYHEGSSEDEDADVSQESDFEPDHSFHDSGEDEEDFDADDTDDDEDFSLDELENKSKRTKKTSAKATSKVRVSKTGKKPTVTKISRKPVGKGRQKKTTNPSSSTSPRSTTSSKSNSSQTAVPTAHNVKPKPASGGAAEKSISTTKQTAIPSKVMSEQKPFTPVSKPVNEGSKSTGRDSIIPPVARPGLPRTLNSCASSSSSNRLGGVKIPGGPVRVRVGLSRVARTRQTVTPSSS